MSDDIVAKSGRTVDAQLLMAVVENDCDLIREALNQGADPNAVNAENDASALDAASTRDFHECVALLIDSGADVDRVDEDGMTPTMGAAWFGATRALSLLLEAGADPKRVEPKRGMSALHLCCSDGLGAEAKLLCDRGGFTEAKSLEGHTVLDLAIKVGNPRLAGYLAPKFSLEALEEARAKWRLLEDESADLSVLGIDGFHGGLALESYRSAITVADAKQLAKQLEGEVPQAQPGRRPAI